MKLPPDAIIAPEKVLRYLLVPRADGDKSAFLAFAGFSLANADVLLHCLARIRDENEARPVDFNEFGYYYEATAVLQGPNGVRLSVITIWMTEHLSGQTKFITLIPQDILHP